MTGLAGSLQAANRGTYWLSIGHLKVDVYAAKCITIHMLQVGCENGNGSQYHVDATLLSLLQHSSRYLDMHLCGCYSLHIACEQ